MTKDKVSNVAASVRQRLLNIIHETGDEASLVWTRYATERLLYRLSVSEYAGDFILKFEGAILTRAIQATFKRRDTEIPLEIRRSPPSGKGLFAKAVLNRVCPSSLMFFLLSGSSCSLF
jgi:hypothetical protein